LVDVFELVIRVNTTKQSTTSTYKISAVCMKLRHWTARCTFQSV